MEALASIADTAIEACLQQWRAALPDGRVSTDVSRYRENCLNLDRSIIAAIRPESEEEIITAVKIANQYRVPLYTISTGHNWGYGSSLPVTDGCAILDLSRMNRIIDFDAELGLVTLEPGVTQKQLADYLNDNQLDFYVPTTGAGPTVSIVGNALERGFGMTPEEDHFRAVTSIRAVLADGSIYRSCFAESGAPYAGVWKWGIGPYVDGLFAQGNIGIVTSLQIALSPRCEHTELYLFHIQNEEDLEPTISACRRLLKDMHGTVGHIKLFNRAQLESTVGKSQTGTGLMSDFSWMGFGVFRCRKRMAPAIRAEIRRTLKMQTDRLIFVNERRYNWLRRLIRWIPGSTGAVLKRQLGSIEYLMDLANGVPRSDALGLVYQYIARPDGPPVDPVRDGAGIIWYAPVLPLKPALVMRMIDMIRDTLAKHGFTQAMTITMSSDKCAVAVVPIIYKRPEGADQAHRCFNELWERGSALGCPPYRVNVAAMSRLTGQPDSVYWNTVARIKAALDQNNILSPVRYTPLHKQA